ncbi:MAG: DAK2 domain-containing protein [Caldilineaceae bacterium]|nr:DAK2 domain-containing protein [Caldilineaceae bacterium]
MQSQTGPVSRDVAVRMLGAATAWVARHREQLNRENVFPVPDGDTGTNLTLTLQAVVEAVGGSDPDDAQAIWSRAAQGALAGSRGNSGVILSQFMAGFAAEVTSAGRLDAAVLQKAFAAGAGKSQSAVAEPREGTVLTVARDVAEHVACLSVSVGFDAMLSAACEEARDSVQRTPELLPVLKEAGVVDAGGWGLTLYLEGLLKGFRGVQVPEFDLPTETVAPAPAGYARGEVPAVEHGFDIQFLAHHPVHPVDQMRAELQAMGEYGLVEGSEELVKVHVHARDPGAVLSWGSASAFITDIVVENLDAQAAAMAKDRALTQDPGTVRLVQPARSDELALVAVAAGPGFAELFESLGANCLIQCNDTYNPSVGQFQDAIRTVGGSHVLVLPNHSNALPAAQAAVASLPPASATVIGTPFVLSGVAAMYRFEPSGGPRDLVVGGMQEAAEASVYGSVAKSVRNSGSERGPVLEGQFVALAGGETVLGGWTRVEDAVDFLLREYLQPRFASVQEGQAEFLTVYRGADARPEQDAVVEALVAAATSLDLEWVDTRQRNHMYLFAIE